MPNLIQAVHAFVKFRIDFILFTGLNFLTAFLIHSSLKRFCKRGIPVLVWMGLACFLAGGGILAEVLAIKEQANLERLLGVFGPSYAYEMRQKGHGEINFNTPADDPEYLKLIQTEILWLKLNPVIRDIYTFARRPDGRYGFLVDSETDYDGNGKYEGARESRTPLGEVVEIPEQAASHVFSGRQYFDTVPYTDRWGTWVSVYTPIPDPSGSIKAAIGVDYAASDWVRSLLLQRQAAFALTEIAVLLLMAFSSVLIVIRAGETRLRAVYDSSQLGIFLADTEGRCIYANRSFSSISGLKTEEILGNGWIRVLHPEDRDRVMTGWKKASLTRTPYQGTHRFLLKDYSIAWTKVLASPIYESGQFTGFIATIEDITEQKKLESIVLQNEKMSAVGLLAAGVAHEINNPLGVILGFTQSMKEHVPPGTELSHPLKSIEREAERCKHLVQDLLAFSRPQKLEKEKIDLNEALKTALSLVVTQAKVSCVEFVQDLEPGLPLIFGNANQIQQVILNLSSNAIDAMPNGGKLTVKTSRVMEKGIPKVRIDVIDTGAGIPPEIRGKIFEPFFTTKEVGKGTGLGLSLVYEIVHGHGGEIRVESEGGKGTSFILEFPV